MSAKAKGTDRKKSCSCRGAGRGECVREASFKDDMDRRSLVGGCVRERESRGGGFQ